MKTLNKTLLKNVSNTMKIIQKFALYSLAKSEVAGGLVSKAI